MKTPVIDMWAPIVPTREIMDHVADNSPEAQLGYLRIFQKRPPDLVACPVGRRAAQGGGRHGHRPLARRLADRPANCYCVLRLEGGKRGPKFLLRSAGGHLFGVYGRNVQAALSAALLELKLIIDTFRGFDLCETPEGTLFVRG